MHSILRLKDEHVVQYSANPQNKITQKYKSIHADNQGCQTRPHLEIKMDNTKGISKLYRPL